MTILYDIIEFTSKLFGIVIFNVLNIVVILFMCGFIVATIDMYKTDKILTAVLGVLSIVCITAFYYLYHYFGFL